MTDGPNPSSTGPVGAGNPPPPPVAEASSGEGPPTPPPADEAPAQTGADEAQGEALEKDLDELLADTQRERDEYLELAKRTKADFENFRKRMSTETQAAFLRGRAEISLALIDAVDNLERALAAAGVDPDGEDALGGDTSDSSAESGEDTGAGSDQPSGLAHGVLLVFRRLRETLGQMGIEAIDPKGEKFDPQLHEALSTLATDGAEAGTVVEVMQKGYLLGEQLVRPARVVVAE